MEYKKIEIYLKSGNVLKLDIKYDENNLNNMFNTDFINLFGDNFGCVIVTKEIEAFKVYN